MKNLDQKTISIILGVLLAVSIICCIFCWSNGWCMKRDGMMTHRMGNGEMMKDMDMDDGKGMMNKDMSMASMMNAMNKNLEGKTGDDFDKAFITEMIMHHEGAVLMANMVLKTSKRPELLALAKEIIAAQTREIDMMNSWKNAWFK